MTGRRGPDTRGTPNAPGEAAILRRTARLLRTHLRRNRLDFAPLPELARTIGISEDMLRASVAQYPDLGTCGRASAPHVWWLPLQPLDAGFRPVLHSGQLTLRLKATHPARPALYINGRHLGPAPEAELNLPELRTIGVGPLAYTVVRLLLMADRWFTESTRSSTGQLFELVASTWHTSQGPVWSSGRLHIHQGHDPDPAATRLELVVWADPHGARQLVNLYPAGTHRTVFHAEARQ